MCNWYPCQTKIGLLSALLVLAVVAAASGQTWTSGFATDKSGVRGSAPPNDLCADATEITTTPFQEDVDSSGATPDIDVSCNAKDRPVTDYGFWYTYTPLVDCDVQISAGAWSVLDIPVAVFTGPDCNTLTEIECVDSGHGSVFMTATPGVKYWILVGCYDDKMPGEPIGFYLNSYRGACCVGQSCMMTPPSVCQSMGGHYLGDDTECTPGVCDTGACCYPDGSCSVLDPNACASTGGNWSNGGTTCFPNVCPQPAPENDLCENATDVLTMPFFDMSVNMELATPDIYMSCAADGCSETGYGVWYTYTPTANCDLTIQASATTSMETYAIGVFTGSSCSKLTEITCGYDNMTIQATGGEKYWILIGLYKCYGFPNTYADVYINATSGACCVGETCMVEGEIMCASLGGVFAGEGVPCDPQLCLTGACCTLDGTCQVLSADACAAAGGIYRGGSTTCDPSPCALPGDDCTNPLVVELPLELNYTDANQTTCGRDNDYWGTCLNPFDGGDDIVYQLNVTSAVCVDVTVTGNDPNNAYIGFAINETCPLGTSCKAGAYTEGTQAFAPGVLMEPGTYYLMVDSWPPPFCLTDFTLTITNSAVCEYGACCDPKGGCYETYERLCEDNGGTFAGDGTSCAADCNNSGLPDACDIVFGMSPDCQGNGVPDECDVASGNSLDGNLNGVPDECDPDCNTNGIPDDCEVPGGCATGDCGTVYPAACGLGDDCQQNGLLDDCEVDGTAAVFEYSIDDGTAEGRIGIMAGAYLIALSKYTVVEDAEMITAVNVVHGDISDGVPVTAYIWADPTQDSVPSDAYVIAQGSSVTANGGEDIFNTIMLDTPVVVGPAGTEFFVGLALYSNEYAFALDYTSSTPQTHWLVANGKSPVDPNDLGNPEYYPPLSTIESSGFAANLMFRALGAPVGDCNGNGTPDACDVAPICVGGPPLCSEDCNGNLVPDDCELAWYDCNGNGVPDDCDIAGGVSQDCDGNGTPDECDVADCDGSAWCSDCDGNGTMDVCDILYCAGDPACSDCNLNGIPDGCDIVDCKGELWCADCQFDGIPDGCQLDGNKSRAALLTENFEGGLIPPVNWTAIANNAFTWERWDMGAYEGTYYALCQYDMNYTGTQDEWLISPEVRADGQVTLSGYTWGGYYFGVKPHDNFDVEVWMINGPAVNDGDDLPLGKLDDVWYSDGSWSQFTYDFTAPTTPFRVAFRYLGFDGAAAGIDLITLDGEPAVPSNDCNGNGIPDECDLCGDLDLDGDVDYDDYVIFRDAFGGVTDGEPAVDYCCDYDGSGAVGMADFDAWLGCYRAYVNDPLAGPPTVGKRRIRVPLSPLPKQGLGPVPSP